MTLTSTDGGPAVAASRPQPAASAHTNARRLDAPRMSRGDLRLANSLFGRSVATAPCPFNPTRCACSAPQSRGCGKRLVASLSRTQQFPQAIERGLRVARRQGVRVERAKFGDDRGLRRVGRDIERQPLLTMRGIGCMIAAFESCQVAARFREHVGRYSRETRDLQSETAICGPLAHGVQEDELLAMLDGIEMHVGAARELVGERGELEVVR